MSLRALTWAMEHGGCPSSSAKLVLLAFANFANEQHWSYPSTETIARLTKLDPKTVRASTDALEEAGLIVDTGKRAGRTRQVKVYRLSIESHPISDTLPRPPESDGLSERKAPNFSGKGTQKRVAEPVLEPLPPSEANASDTPKGDDGTDPEPDKRERVRGSRIPDGWTPPSIDQLSPKAGALVAIWPAGAYAAEAEAFANYWAGEGGAKARKVDWAKTWCNWVVSISARVLRAEKAGVRYEPLSITVDPEKPGECADAHAIRRHLIAERGAATYRQWIEPLEISANAGVITIRAPSKFMADWLKNHMEHPITDACRKALGHDWKGLRWDFCREGRLGGSEYHHGEVTRETGRENQGQIARA